MPEPLSLLVTPEEEGLRLDQMLARRLPETSRTLLKNLIVAGEVTVNGAESIPRHKVKTGDQLRLVLRPAATDSLLPEKMPLDVVYEDADLAVIDKPAGLVVHPGAGVKSGTLANALVHHFQEFSGSSAGLRPGIVHRLDRGTSGLIVVAKTQSAWLKLARQFKARTVTKLYCALVYGNPQLDGGTIDAPIGRHPTRRVQMSVRPQGRGRSAVTNYRVMERLEGFTLLELAIKTGRTHQIRVHLAHVGLPVVVDSTYGSGAANRIRNAKLRLRLEGLRRPFLHAMTLVFTHPATGEPVQFHSSLPRDLKDLLGDLRTEGEARRTTAPK